MRRSRPQKTIGKPTLKSLALSNDTGGLLRRPALFEVRGPESGDGSETSPDASIGPSVLGLNQSLLISQTPQLDGLILDERENVFLNNGQAIGSPCLNLNGSSQYINTPLSSLSVDFNGSRSFAIRFSPSSFPTTASLSSRFFTQSSGPSTRLSMGLQADRLSFAYNDGRFTVVSGTTSLNINETYTCLLYTSPSPRDS